MMVGLSVFCPLLVFLCFPLVTGPAALVLRCSGARVGVLRSVSGRCVGKLTALCSLSPQQEGLDDGPDFLSEEDRGVSVQCITYLSACLSD